MQKQRFLFCFFLPTHTTFLMFVKIQATGFGASGLSGVFLMKPDSIMNYLYGLFISYLFGFLITMIFIKSKTIAKFN